jgi:hypothetical protein
MGVPPEREYGGCRICTKQNPFKQNKKVKKLFSFSYEIKKN